MLTLCLWTWLVGQSFGAPLVVRTTQTASPSPYESPWQIAPSTRGTSTLLISCFATLFFAAWTAYHPNVPAAGSGGNTIITRLQWILVAALAPEIVLWKAWLQLFGALRFKRRINNALDEGSGTPRTTSTATDRPTERDETSTGPANAQTSAVPIDVKVSTGGRTPQPAHWTLRQAFFASTGGVAVRSASFHSLEYVCFTEKGLLLLAKCGALPELPLDQVEDKSKAGAFQKIIVCTQGIWFVAQTIARWAQGLPVSLLELHVVIHVFCALAMFAFWWQKGYDVGTPLIMDDDAVVDFAALFSLENGIDRFIEDLDLDWYKPSNRKVSMYCSHYAHPPSLSRFARSAHRYPLQPYGSWSWGALAAGWKKPCSIENVKISEHCRRARRALGRLRTWGVHVLWHGTESRGADPDAVGSVEFPEGPYVARNLTHFYTEGVLKWNDLAPAELWQAILTAKLPSPRTCACPFHDQLIVNERLSMKSDFPVPMSWWNGGFPRRTESDRWYPADLRRAMPDYGVRRAATAPILSDASRPSTSETLSVNQGAVGSSNDSIGPPRALDATTHIMPGFCGQCSHTTESGDHTELDVTSTTSSGTGAPETPDAMLTREVGMFTIYCQVFKLDWVALVFFCTAYGGAHMAAWDHTFPSDVEMWLWRGVCLYLLSIPVSMILYLFFWMLSILLPNWSILRPVDRAFQWLSKRFFAIAIGQIGTYWLARMFLLAEALAALREPVAGTYENVRWSIYVPHFG